MDFKCRFLGKISQMTKDGIQGQTLTERNKVNTKQNLQLFNKIDDNDKQQTELSQQKYQKKSQLSQYGSQYICNTQYYENNQKEYDEYSQRKQLTEVKSNLVINSNNNKGHRSLNYKPYNYQEYKNLNVIQLSRGLGPNINNEQWKQKKQNQQKILKYSERLQLENKEKMLYKKPLEKYKIYVDQITKNTQNEYLEFN